MHHWWKWCVCFVYFLKQSIYFLVGQKLLSKNAICVRMNLSQMSKLSLAANIKKYILQTFEPCVKQRFAPKLAVCYWLYNVNLIKNLKLFIILVWRGGPTSSERGFLNCNELMKLPFVMSITHGKFISSREKLLWQPFFKLM